MSSLAGKTIIVTGASSGIGAGTSLRLAQLGCKLSLVGRNMEALNKVAEECKEKGALDTLIIVKDLSSATGCQEAIDKTVEYYQSNFRL